MSTLIVSRIAFASPITAHCKLVNTLPNFSIVTDFSTTNNFKSTSAARAPVSAVRCSIRTNGCWRPLAIALHLPPLVLRVATGGTWRRQKVWNAGNKGICRRVKRPYGAYSLRCRRRCPCGRGKAPHLSGSANQRCTGRHCRVGRSTCVSSRIGARSGRWNGERSAGRVWMRS